MRGPRSSNGALRIGGGPSNTAPHGWTPRQLGAAFVFDPALVTLRSGTAIASAADAGGGPVVLASSAGAEMATSTAGVFGSKIGIRTSNTTGRLFSATGGPVGAAPFHLVTIVQMMVDDGSAYRAIWSMGAPNAAHVLFLADHSSHEFLVADDTGGVAQSYLADPTPTASTAILLPHVLEVQYDGTTLSLWYDGLHYTLGDKVTALATSDASFGAQRWNTGFTLGDAILYSLALRTGGVWTRSQVQSFLRYELRRLGSVGRIVALWGDSTTQGGAVGATPPKYLPPCVRAQTSGGNVLFVQNQGISGQRSDQIAARLTAGADPATHNVFWWGVNDISQLVPAGLTSTGVATADAALVYAQTRAAVALSHARGSKAVVATVQEWNASLDTYRHTWRTTYNALVVANSAGADAVADVDAAMGPYDASKFVADGIHPSDTANLTIIAPVIYAAIVAAG